MVIHPLWFVGNNKTTQSSALGAFNFDTLVCIIQANGMMSAPVGSSWRASCMIESLRFSVYPGVAKQVILGIQSAIEDETAAAKSAGRIVTRVGGLPTFPLQVQ